MKLQDLVFVVGIALLSLSLIPTIRGRQKPALATSLMTFVILVIFTLTDASLKLWYTAVITALSALAWLTLAVQKAQQGKRRR